MTICQLDYSFCRKRSLFCKNIWWSPQKAVLLHRFSMTPALKVRETSRDAHALVRTKNGISLKKKGDNYEEVYA